MKDLIALICIIIIIMILFVPFEIKWSNDKQQTTITYTPIIHLSGHQGEWINIYTVPKQE